MIFTKKSLGQNFLIDQNIIKKIINLTNINKKNIVEIGSGKGALTDEILKKNPKSLIIIEKDINLAEQLKLKYTGVKNVKIFNADILNFNIESTIKENSIIFGNLPYNISSQILVKFLRFRKWTPKYKELIFMFQKELGEKIIAQYPSSNYGRLSILTNYRFKLKNKFMVSANCFFPKPKVTSLVVHFVPKKESFKFKNINNLEKVTNTLFSNKRKMINKNIKKLLNKEKINIIRNLKLSSRPSEIEPNIYYKITELFEKL
jgi:16S rRNA (adenine1518-N6/adenine1519-N6)-dimethyltransferase